MTGMELHLWLGLVRSPRAWIPKTLEWATPQGTPAAPRPSLQHPYPLPAVRLVAHKHLSNQFSELPFSCLEQGRGRSPLRGGCSHGLQGIGRLAVSAQGSLRSRQGNWSFTTGARGRVTNSQAVPRPREGDTSSALASKFFLEQESVPKDTLLSPGTEAGEDIAGRGSSSSESMKMGKKAESSGRPGTQSNQMAEAGPGHRGSQCWVRESSHSSGTTVGDRRPPPQAERDLGGGRC